jgi:hypothetical protein
LLKLDDPSFLDLESEELELDELLLLELDGPFPAFSPLFSSRMSNNMFMIFEIPPNMEFPALLVVSPTLLVGLLVRCKVGLIDVE